LSHTLEKAFGTSAQNLELKFLKNVGLLKVTNLALTRFTFNKKSFFITIGSNEINTLNSFQEENKCLELINALKSSIEDELKSFIQAIELKSTIDASRAHLGILETCETHHALSIQFILNGQKQILLIPLESKMFNPQFLAEHAGFNENSKVLIVDDSRMNRLVLKTYLLAAGFIHLEEAAEGRSALLKIRQSITPFNLVIADWHMPEISGIELLKEVRGNSETKNMPFILATSEQKKEEIMEAVKYKVSGYLVKPYSPQSLMKSMKNAKEASEK